MDIMNNAIIDKYGTYIPFKNRRVERLKFKLDYENITDEARNKLIKITKQRISDRQPLPDGIKLVECTITEDN